MYKKSLLEECKKQIHLFSIKDGVIYANGKPKKPSVNRMVSAPQKVDGKYLQFSANLVAWLVLHGDIPDTMMARRIDESKGFTKDNMEMYEPSNIKTVVGKKPTTLDVSVELAVEIRRKYKDRFSEPVSYNSLSKEYGRSKASIMTIVNGGKSDFWKEVDAIEGPPEKKGRGLDPRPKKPRTPKPKPSPKPKAVKPKKKEVSSIFKLFMNEAKKEIKKKKQEISSQYMVDINPFADEELGGW